MFSEMGPQRLALVCLCALAATTTLSAAFPTQETLVVAKSDMPVSKDYDFIPIIFHSFQIYPSSEFGYTKDV